MEKRKSICILALSPIARDGRVLRQIQYLAPYYDLTVVGYGPAHPDLAHHPHVAWVEVAPPPGSVESVGTEPKGREDRRQAHLGYTLRRILFRLALHAGRHLPAFYNLAYSLRWGYQLALQGKLARRFDAYHANDWNTLPVAAAAAQRHHAKLVVDLHEYAPLEFENLRDWWLFEPLIRSVLQRYATDADALMTVAAVIAERYRHELGLDPLVVLNAPEYISPPLKQLDPHNIRLVHHGVAYQIRKPEVMIQTIALCESRYTLHFMLVPAPYIEALKKLAAEIAPGRVFFHDAVAPEKIVSTIAQFDVGFNFIAPTNYNYRVCLPNKFFESLMAGLAICTGPSPSMVEMVEQYGCGVVAPSFEPQALAAVLNQTSAEQWAVMQQAARAAAKELNAAHEMQKVVDLYERLFAEN